ncbi:acyl carrier protein phosphodiesterase [Gilvibacter sediminis]|uniref:acyl carrier protein phosphodiesterase n=1 Tax=Gilvibacter sediminis TaxID=379071 RepID=UPI0023503A5C|nr:acyl carrier protein phosphodiesterase [Gilvibacter sediminis]MDC7999100.1 acyl carrier protein phosphodiesterase [Gilvibacter sediminis]
MNYLAHIYLSGGDPEVTVGNFMADAVKGKNYLNYSEGIQRGIILHRAIDTFTDSHPIVKQSSKRLHKKYGHYSGVIVDILYDHFLAANWSDYSDQPLDQYVQDFYHLLEAHHDIVPERIQKIMPIMFANNWLLSYATVEGIGKILFQMNRRTKNRSKMNFAILELEAHYEEFYEEFTTFFAELMTYSAEKLKTL